MNQEFESLQQLLDGDYQVHEKEKKKQRASMNPVAKLSNSLLQYKTERIGTEDQLIKCIEKVNLDKSILFREKKDVLWKDTDNQDQTNLEDGLRRGKQNRHETNKRQKEAYTQILLFLKQRGTKPVQEEKQILDGIKIILDNGWIMQTDELLTFFETLNLKSKLTVQSENLKFLEFIYILCRLFEADVTKI